VDRLALARGPASRRAGSAKACADLPSYLKALQIQEVQSWEDPLVPQKWLFFERRNQRRGQEAFQDAAPSSSTLPSYFTRNTAMFF
jgi:hypothetical protein